MACREMFFTLPANTSSSKDYTRKSKSPLTPVSSPSPETSTIDILVWNLPESFCVREIIYMGIQGSFSQLKGSHFTHYFQLALSSGQLLRFYNSCRTFC